MPTLVDHAKALSAINADQDAAIARDVAALFTAYGSHPDFPAAAHAVLPEILDQHAQAAGLITAQWYDEIDPGSTFAAKPFDEIPRVQIDKTVDWALYAPGDEPPQSRLTTSSQRMVRNVSRQTVTRNAADEGVLWARLAQPDACAFCRVLAMRGSGRDDRKWLYGSDKTALFRRSDGEKYHKGCSCQAVPVRGGQVWTPPDYTAGWDEEYAAAVKRVKRGKNYFERLVADIRANEPKPEPAPDTINRGPVELPPSPEVAAQARREVLKRLDAADNLLDVTHAANEVLPDTEVVFTSRDADVEQIKQAVHAVDDVMQKYPNLHLDYLHDNNDESCYARTWNFGMLSPNTPPGITINRRWLDNPDDWKRSWDKGVEAGFHYAGTGDPAYDALMHEMGHVVNDYAEVHGIAINLDDVSTALADYYIVTKTGSPKAAANMATMSKVMLSDDYEQWLRDNLSGYSWVEAHFGRGGPNAPIPEFIPAGINVVEALAEAFADVEINGDNAHDTSKVLHRILTDAYKGIRYSDIRYGAAA